MIPWKDAMKEWAWNVAKWALLVAGAVAAVGGIVVAVCDDASADDILRIERTAICLDTDRHVNALWVSVPTANVERGRDIPPTWSFQVSTTLPGITYVSMIAACTSEYVTGAGLEVVSGCGEFIYGAPELSGLQTTDFVQIVTECFGCCCEPTLTISGGCSVAGVDVPAPPTWTTIKGIYR